MRLALPACVLALAAAAAASPAWACTLCHSRTASEVRAAVLGPDFWPHLAALGLPVPLLVAAVLMLRRLSP